MKRTTHIAAAALAIALAGCRKEPVHEKSITPVKLKALELETITTETRYAANIVPGTQVTVSFRVGGYVEKLMQVHGRDVEQGDFVEKGAVLAQLRARDFENKVAQARAQHLQAQAGQRVAESQLADARAGLTSARQDLARATNLLAAQSLTKAEFDNAKARNDSMEAKVAAAQAQVQAFAAQASLGAQVVREGELAQDDSALKAPRAGYIMKRIIDSGALAAPGSPGFVIADTSVVKAVFGVPDSAIATIKLGQQFPCETDALPGITLRGTVTNISPSADPKSRVFDVELTISNGNNQLKPGMIASVIIGGGGAQQALVVPLNAVVRSSKGPDQYAVFVVEQVAGKATARMREVRLGKALSHGVTVEAGVAKGESVIVSGATLLSDNEPVQILP